MTTKEYHEGYVTDNSDPQKRGRLSVVCQSIVAGEVLEWVEPTFPFTDSEGQAGWFFVPNIGSSVTVEINSGHEAEVNDLQPKWRCDLYPDGSFPEEFEDNYPQRRGFKTKEGHYLYFDDTEGSLEFLYHHPSGTEIFVSNDGQIELRPASGQSVLVGGGATEKIPLGNVLKTLLEDIKTAYDTHTHTGGNGGMVATGVPSVSFPPVTDSILSTLHKVE